MFQFSAFAHLRVIHLQCIRFPHSEIKGSKCICHSPLLIAAYHVFLRLSEPRHPPCALSNLLISSFLLFVYYFNQFQYVNELFVVSIFGLRRIKNGHCTQYPYNNDCKYSHVWEVKKWRITESNRWPPACKAGALASWANPPICFFYKVVPSRFELLTPTLSV